MAGTNRVERPGGWDQAGLTQLTATLPTSSTQITLNNPSQKITIKNNGTTEILYVAWDDSTATSADFALIGGQSHTYEGPAIAAFKILGSANTSTYSILAY